MSTATDDTSGFPGDSSASVVYEITYTDGHVIALWTRLRQSKRRRRMFMRTFRVVAGLLLGGLIVLATRIGGREHWLPIAGLVGVLAVLIFSEQIDRWFVVRRWRKALTRNKRTRVAISSEGLSSRSDFGRAAHKWAAYTVARRFPDGFLIFSGPYVPSWFPHAALVQGTPNDAAAFFKANITNYQEA